MTPGAPAQDVARSGKPERASLDVRRMMGLQTASDMLGGQQRIAEALSIDPRSVRAKLSAERGVFDADLDLVADALEARAAKLIEHARKLRALTETK